MFQNKESGIQYNYFLLAYEILIQEKGFFFFIPFQRLIGLRIIKVNTIIVMDLSHEWEKFFIIQNVLRLFYQLIF